MRRADVVIVGGGLAGLSAAVTLCAKSNLDVALIERKGIGSNKAVRAVFSEAIDEFELRDSVLQNYTSYIFHSPLGALARYDYGRVALSGIDYHKACLILHERALRHGLQVVQATATHWSPIMPDFDQPLQIHLNNGESIQAQILIDASGPAQWAARLLRIQRSTYLSICYGELLTNCAPDDPGSFRLLAPNRRYGNGGGWVYPTDSNTLSLGYSIVVPQDHTKRTLLVPGYWAAKREFQPYANWVQGGVRQRIEGGLVPVGRIGHFVANHILIVGDAAGQANPWSVEGCRPCLQNGRLCAQVVLRAFAKKCFDHSILAEYEYAWLQENHERFWRTASAADVMWTRSDREWDRSVRMAQRVPPQQQLKALRDNSASIFEQVYAVAGYLRRQLVRQIAGTRLLVG